jgi:hypothetical protein
MGAQVFIIRGTRRLNGALLAGWHVGLVDIFIMVAQAVWWQLKDAFLHILLAGRVLVQPIWNVVDRKVLVHLREEDRLYLNE